MNKPVYIIMITILHLLGIIQTLKNNTCRLYADKLPCPLN